MTIKIAFFIRSLHKGGAEKQAILLTKYLGQKYITSLIVFYDEGEYMSFAKQNGIDLVLLKGNFFQKTLDLYRFLKRCQITFLFNFLPINNVIGTLVGKIAGVPFVFGGIRGSKINNSRLKMFLQKHIQNTLANGVISNSHRARESYLGYGFDSEKIIVIHNSTGVPNGHIARKEVNHVQILSVGRFISEKDYSTSLKAIRHLAELLPHEGCSFKYRIIGYGPLENLIREQVKSMGLETYVTIFDGQKELKQYYEQADIFLTTSVYEGMSNTVMEAMSYSLPVVATDAGDIKFLVQDGINGFLCPVGDHKEIARSLKILIFEHSRRHRFSLNAYQHIRNNFSPKHQTSQYVNLIENSLKRA